MLSLEIMPPLMFGGLVVFLLMGFPVAFSLSAVGLFFGFISIEMGFFTTAYLGNLPLRVFGILSNDLLLSIPFFTFMGAILERCGLAEDLLEGTGQLFGKIPGGGSFRKLTKRRSVDYKSLEANHPEVYAEVVTITEPDPDQPGALP